MIPLFNMKNFKYTGIYHSQIEVYVTDEMTTHLKKKHIFLKKKNTLFKLTIDLCDYKYFIRFNIYLTRDIFIHNFLTYFLYPFFVIDFF